MRKSNKAALVGKYLKEMVQAADSPSKTRLVIDRGWLLYQCAFVSGETFGTIAQRHLRFVKEFKKDVTVVFDGYKPSPGCGLRSCGLRPRTDSVCCLCATGHWSPGSSDCVS